MAVGTEIHTLTQIYQEASCFSVRFWVRGPILRMWVGGAGGNRSSAIHQKYSRAYWMPLDGVNLLSVTWQRCYCMD